MMIAYEHSKRHCTKVGRRLEKAAILEMPRGAVAPYNNPHGHIVILQSRAESLHFYRLRRFDIDAKDMIVDKRPIVLRTCAKRAAFLHYLGWFAAATALLLMITTSRTPPPTISQFDVGYCDLPKSQFNNFFDQTKAVD